MTVHELSLTRTRRSGQGPHRYIIQCFVLSMARAIWTREHVLFLTYRWIMLAATHADDDPTGAIK